MVDKLREAYRLISLWAYEVIWNLSLSTIIRCNKIKRPSIANSQWPIKRQKYFLLFLICWVIVISNLIQPSALSHVPAMTGLRLSVLYFGSVKRKSLRVAGYVAQNCLSRQEGLFLAIKTKRGASGIPPGEKANQNQMQMNWPKSEFFGSRGFWFFFPEKKNKKKDRS